MSETLFDIVQQACNEVLIPAPSSVIGSTDEFAMGMLAMAQASGRDLVRRFEWGGLVTLATIPTVASQSDYTLPTDYYRMVDDTAWDQSTHWFVGGPLSPAADRYLRDSVVGASTVYRSFRLPRPQDPHHTDTAGCERAHRVRVPVAELGGERLWRDLNQLRSRYRHHGLRLRPDGESLQVALDVRQGPGRRRDAAGVRRRARGPSKAQIRAAARSTWAAGATTTWADRSTALQTPTFGCRMGLEITSSLRTNTISTSPHPASRRISKPSSSAPRGCGTSSWQDASGNAVPLANYVVTGEFTTPGLASPVPLTVANGRIVVVNAATGEVNVTLESNLTRAVYPQPTPPYPTTKVTLFITDSVGNRTPVGVLSVIAVTPTQA